MSAVPRPESQQPYLAVSNIEVIYDHVILVLKDVSLSVPEGKIVALLGANGAGKTTTLKAISNLLRAERGEVTKGTIEFRGRRVDRLSLTSSSGLTPAPRRPRNSRPHKRQLDYAGGGWTGGGREIKMCVRGRAWGAKRKEMEAGGRGGSGRVLHRQRGRGRTARRPRNSRSPRERSNSAGGAWTG